MATSQPVIKLSDKVRQELNSIQQDAQAILAEAQKQDGAMVPEMDAVIGRCQECINRIGVFKEVNFPGKK